MFSVYYFGRKVENAKTRDKKEIEEMLREKPGIMLYAVLKSEEGKKINLLILRMKKTIRIIHHRIY